MAKILIADDRQANREFLQAILHYSGHQVFEASEGSEALRITKEQRPALVIVDILMPVMDGYEFARSLRADPEIAKTPILFYTASYRQQEAKEMAKTFGVAAILYKPCEPEEVLRVVESVLGVSRPPQTPAYVQAMPVPLQDRVFQEGLAREAASQRLEALAEASLTLSAEQDPQKLLDTFTHIARDIIGAHISTAGVLNPDGVTLRRVAVLGFQREFHPNEPAGQGILSLIKERRPIRRKNPEGDPTTLGLTPAWPPVFSFMALPIFSSEKNYGWLTLANKIGAEEFSEEDERLARALTAQVAVIYENALRCQELQQRLTELEKEINERREVEKKQVRLIEIFDNTTDLMSTIDMTGRVLTLNRAARKIMGIGERDELPEKPFQRNLSTEETERFHKEIFPTLLRDGVWSGELKQPSFNNSSEKYLSQVSILHRGPDGSPDAISTISRDITEQKQLQEKQSHLVSILDNTPSYVVITDMAGRYTYMNSYARQGFGLSAQDPLPTTALQINQPRSQTDFIYNTLLPALMKDGVWTGETSFTEPGGKERMLYRVSLLHRSPEGEPKYISTIARDITDQKRTEEQLRQAQKMEAIGQLAGGVAHDFNNILMVIMSYSALLLDSFEPDDPRSSGISEINSAAERAASLTRQLLAFSRQEVIQPKILELNSVVSNVNKMLKRLLGEDINLDTNLSSTLGRIKADPGQIEQIIMNLAVNARDAMPQGGRLTIETSNVMLDETYTRQHLGVNPGSYVMLAVSDNGSGMSKEIQSRIFEPFFTTKEKGKGTGLGLSTVYGIVQQNGGHISVYSEPGRGTTFKVYLPRVDQDPVLLATPKGTTHLKAKEKILLVEDDHAVRRILQKVLQQQGYTLVEAKNGREALQAAEKMGDFDLLITDVVMPEMSGPEMVKLLKKTRPDVKVLYLSGYTDNAISRHGLLETGFTFLQKPFTLDALKLKVREVLEG